MAALRRFLPKLGIGLVLACGVVMFGPLAFGIVYLGAWSLATGQLPTVSFGDEPVSRDTVRSPRPPPVQLPFVPGPPLTPERFAREPLIAVNHIPERGDCWARSEFRQRRDPPAGTVCRWTLKPSVTDGSLGMSSSMSPGCWGWISEATIIVPAGGGIPPPDP